MATTPYQLTASDMEAVYDDIAVCCSGEDGDMIALGHYDPAVALAAFNRHAREYLKIANVADDDALTTEELADFADCTTAQWGIARQATAEEEANQGWVWVLTLAKKDDSGAIPYTFLALD